MKRRPWLWILLGIPAIIVLLIVVASISDAHHERVRRAEMEANPRRGRGGSAFGPREIWAAASPGAGLMEALSPREPARALAKKTLGSDLQEAEVDKNPKQPVPTSPLKLIRTGNVALEVGDFDQATKVLGQLVQSLGGYVADTQVQRNPSGARSGTVTLRVPATSYESAGSKIRTLGKVLSERSNVQDVSKAYTELETRLRVKREALARIRELLRTKAGNLKEVLEVEKEISRITEEIEQAEGERRFYDHQINLSTITVDLNEPEPISLARPSSWWALTEALRDSTAMVAGSLAFMLRLLLVLLPWAALGFGVVWAVRRWRQKRLPAPPAEVPPTPTNASPRTGSHP